MLHVIKTVMNGRGYYISEGLLITFLAVALVIQASVDLTPASRSFFLILVSSVGIVPVLWSAYRALRVRAITVDLLAGVALVFALIGREWSSVIFVALMLSAARIMTHWNDARTEQNLSGLMKLRPELARVKRGGAVIEIAVAEIAVGDVVLCEVGGRIPVDGRVIEGRATVDEASLTGESLPVEKSPEMPVYSSTLVVSGSLTVRAIRVGRETTLERIIALVERARADKPAVSTLAEQFGKLYILSIFLIAGGLWLFTHDLNLILAVALVVCADDVAIAIPLAYVTAIGTLAKRGVIVKGGRYLEAFGQATTFIFDKTGTITRGQLRVETIHIVGESAPQELLGYVRRLGERSDHPVARALARIDDERAARVHTVQVELTQFEELSGKGLSGTFGEDHLLVGRQALFEERRINLEPSIKAEIDAIETRGQSVVLVALNVVVVGIMGVADEIRPGAREMIEHLRQLGAREIVMLTGDNQAVAARVAEAVGIETFYASLLPQQKLERVEQLTPPGTVSVMVGDGVNDAASLERATVGVAMGAIGYDAAIESANIVLMHDDVRRLPEIIELAHSLRHVVKQNFWIWGVSNVIGLSLVFLGLIGPRGAAAYNFLTDFIPLMNSLKVVRMWFGPGSPGWTKPGNFGISRTGNS